MYPMYLLERLSGLYVAGGGRMYLRPKFPTKNYLIERLRDARCWTLSPKPETINPKP